MRPTRARSLLFIGILAAAVTWALLTVVYSDLPPLSWTPVPALLLAAAAEAWTGRDLRARITGQRGSKPAPPLFVARIVVLAKATSQVGALLAGVSFGFIGYLSSMLGAPTPRSDMITAGIWFGSCLILIAAALFLEYCCRIPKDPGQDRDDDPAPPRQSPFHN
ncbi:MAG TPA: DUF3180 domain-containing protein [Trebonia sp.]|nr:DUF3180 domain-containing protein [Trebonia sp.]